MFSTRRLFPLAVVAALALRTPTAQSQNPAKPACTAPSYRQFDFWLGEWDVRTPDDKAAGSSRITSILGGCVIHEVWSGVGGSNGESFNIFDSARREWHQTWVDNSGLLAQFDGRLSPDGAMILEGPGRAADGSPTRSRMTFTPLPDGRVRQLWEQSADGGASWRSTFDGYYRRRAR